MIKKYSNNVNLEGTATPDQVIDGETFYSTDAKVQEVGTMARRGPYQNATTAGFITNSSTPPGASYFYLKGIPTGFYGPEGTSWGPEVRFPKEKMGDAVAGDVLANKTFTSGGSNSVGGKGTMTNNGGATKAASATDISGTNLRLKVPANAYYNTNSYLTTPLTNLGNATQDEVLSGRTFTSSAGLKKSGTMTNRGGVTQTIAPGASYTIPKGYHDGTGKVTASAATINYKNINQATINNNAQTPWYSAVIDRGVSNTSNRTLYYNVTLGVRYPQNINGGSITLQGSNDNSTWTDVVSKTMDNSTKTPLNLNGSHTTYRYYRVKCLSWTWDGAANEASCYGLMFCAY